MPLTTARRRDAASVQRSGNLANLHHTGGADGIDNRPHILQALHRVPERLVSQRTGIVNQIRAFLLERGIAVRQGIGFLRTDAVDFLVRSPSDGVLH